MRALFAAIFAALLALPSGGWLIQGGGPVDTGKQLLSTGTPSDVGGATDRFVGIGNSTALSATDFNSCVFPVAGTIKSVTQTTLIQPSGSASFVSTVYINGSPTSATATIDSAHAIGEWIGSVSVNAGDRASFFIHPVNNPSLTRLSATIGFTPTTAGDSVICAGAIGGTFSTSATQVLAPFAGLAPYTTVAAKRQLPLPVGGTVDKLFVYSIAPGTAGSGKSYAYTVNKNNAATAITATISNAATANSDTSNSSSPVALDNLEFSAAPTSTPTASDAGFGLRYLPSGGGFPYMTSFITPSPSQTTYTYISNGTVTTTTENVHQMVTRSQTFTNIACKVTPAPGVGKQWDITLRVNGSDSALVCTIAGAATSGSATGTVAVADYDLVDYKIVPTGSPGFPNGMGLSLLATR